MSTPNSTPNPTSHDAGYYSSLNDYGGTASDIFDDSDSAIGDTESLRTTLTDSLTPSVMDYRYENGRRYHAYKDGSYAMPNDEPELERLDLQHQVWRLSLDGMLYLSPLPPSITSALDLGTGTGIWAIEFADEHPSATITGVDLSPVQPRWIPSNCQFQVDDVEEDWTYTPPPPPSSSSSSNNNTPPTTGFDFIHGRMLGMGLKDWPKLFRQSFTHLKPGGYFEAQEFDLTVRCESDSPKQGSAFRRWSDCIAAAACKAGINAQASLNFRSQLSDAGFVDVQCKDLRWPVGPWPEGKKEKTLGLWAQRNMLEGVEAVAMGFLCRYEGWTREQVGELVEAAKAEIVDMGFHQYVDMSVYYAKKPES